MISTLAVAEVRPEAEQTHLWTQMTAGLRHLAGERVLKHVLIGFAVCILVMGFTESAIYALLDAFDKPATYVVGDRLRAGRRRGRRRSRVQRGGQAHRRGRRPASSGLVLVVAGVLVMAATHSFVVVCASAAVFGAAIPMIMVAFMTLIQRRTPQAIMGRVSTAVEVVMATPQAISLALGSLLVVILSYRQIFVIMACVTALAAAYIAILLRDQIASDLRRPVTDGPRRPRVPTTPVEP